MASAAPNPYAPPAGADPVAEPSGLWSVQGEYLLVRPGAWLPPVDLEGDGTGTDLTPVSRTFQALTGGRGQLVFVLPFLVVLLGVALSSLVGRSFGLDSPIAVGLVTLLLIRLISGKGGSGMVAGVVRGYSSTGFLQVQARWHRNVRGLTVLGMLLSLGTLCASFVEGVGSSGIGWRPFLIGMGSGLLLLLAAGVLLQMKRGLRCVRARDGWLYLKGVPASSLSALAAFERQTPLPPKRAKVVKMHLYRQPLGTLLRKHWWNPWIVLLMIILKARRSPRLDRWYFHWSEAVRRPVGEADPALREAWAKESAGTEAESWTPVCAEWIDSPQGDMRIESIIHLSPDRRHIASMAQVRISNGKHYQEIRQTAFRTRMAGGSWLFTSNPPLLPVHPDFLEAEACRGSLGKILARHLARVGSSEVMPLISHEEIHSCMDEEAAARAACQEAYGLQEAPEEQEIPGESVFPPGKSSADHSPPTAAMR